MNIKHMTEYFYIFIFEFKFILLVYLKTCVGIML